MKKWVSSFVACFLFLIAVVCDCSMKSVVSDTGGSTSEVVGRVLYGNGKPAQNAAVRLRRTDYLSDTLTGQVSQDLAGADTVTDDLGEFSVNVADTGNYDIEVNDQKENAVLIRCAVTNTSGLQRLPADTLEPTGTLEGHVALSPDISSVVYVQVFGLERIVEVDPATGEFEIPDMPSANFTLRFVSFSTAQAPTIVNSVNVASGQVTTIDTVKLTGVGLWKYSRRLYLNTTSSGAAVPGNVVNFPILVRLTTSNFDFTQAGPSGADIRFTKQDNTPVSYEIERWDAANDQAEVWVKIDTVYGSDSSHYVTMYWGASTSSATVSLSNGAAVFDTSNGFQGVWHLGQSAAGVSTDATQNHFDGTPSDTAPAAAAGIIGTCQQFNGTSNYILMPGTSSGKLNFPEHGTYTLSAWVNTDTLDTLFQRIICKNNYQYKLQIDHFKTWSFAEYENAVGYELTNYPASAKAWVFVVGVRSGIAQYLYVNGACVNNAITTQPYNVARDTTSDVTIGRSAKTPPGDPCFFKGEIDEVRIENRALDADWIKLCYMNQNSQDRLVVFK
jgi:Concanavalin A-like lectin/glucanases superfamily/Domain of unknown function (DUF2341)